MNPPDSRGQHDGMKPLPDRATHGAEITGAPDATTRIDEFADVDPSQFDRLHPQDEAALDALVNGRFEVGEVDPNVRPMAQGIHNLLSLLDRGPVSDAERRGTLIDLTMTRVAQARRQAARENPDWALSGDDDDALEALVAAGFDVNRVSGAMRYRAKRVANLLGLLDAEVPAFRDASAPESGAPALVERTLTRVQRAIDEHEDRLALTTVGTTSGAEVDARRGWALRLSDVVSVAALLFIGVALVAPMAMGVRAFNQQQACAGNMQAAGLAFGAYAGDFRSLMPVASSARAGTRWTNVGVMEQSNSANLYLLNRAHYTTSPEVLACCGNPSAPREMPDGCVDWSCLSEVSYSYQCQFAERRPNWSSGRRVVILADASPVVRRAIRGEVILPFENSWNHGGRGQNVLYNDGSGEWLTTPNVTQGRGDNIWLPRNIEAEIARMKRSGATDPIEGTEEPEREDDSFVGP